MHLTTDKRLPFDADVAEVWTAMSKVEAYQGWWPWLEEFDANRLAAGEIWKCKIRSPLRYTVAFTLKFDVVVPETHIEASLRGDIVGGAWIDLEDRGGHTDIWIRSQLSPHSRFLKTLTAVLYPVAKYGHDAIIAIGAKQFEEKALG